MKKEYTFDGRKPSFAQCVAAARLLVKRGAGSIVLQWGENWLELQKQSNGFWCGFGFLRDIDADKVAQALNKGAAHV